MVPPARSWGAVLALVPGLASCGAGSAGSSGDISAPTFAEVYATIVSTQCLPCHATGGVGQISGLLDLSTKELAYSNLVGVRSAGVSCATSGLTRVVAGNAAASLLFQKVSSKTLSTPTPCGDSMPDNGVTLTLADVNTIQAWINGGARR